VHLVESCGKALQIINKILPRHAVTVMIDDVYSMESGEITCKKIYQDYPDMKFIILGEDETQIADKYTGDLLFCNESLSTLPSEISSVLYYVFHENKDEGRNLQ